MITDFLRGSVTNFSLPPGLCVTPYLPQIQILYTKQPREEKFSFKVFSNINVLVSGRLTLLHYL